MAESKSITEDSTRDNINNVSEKLNFEALTISSASIKENDLSKQLEKLTASLSPKDREATLSTLRNIFDNIIQHPNDDKYRQIKLTSKTFSSEVWQYPAGEELMKMSGWVVEDDHVRLIDDSYIRIVAQLLEQELKDIPKPAASDPSEISSVATVHKDVTNSSECNILSNELSRSILSAIGDGNGAKLKELLKQCDSSVVNNMQVGLGTSAPIIAFALMARQIGITRILVNEYGVDINVLNSSGHPYFLKLFDGCDSTETSQSLIIQFISEFNIDVNKYCNIGALHLAVLYKLFTVVKFLVEECEVDVNCVSGAAKGGTSLHMACAISDKNIVQYLIEHGADQKAIDDDGRQPKEYEFYKISNYSLLSKFYCKRRVIYKTYGSPEHNHYVHLCAQGISEMEAVDLTLKRFPSLQKDVDVDLNWRNLEVTPTLKELNHYIIEMAPHYRDVGLELDISNSQLKLIKNDPTLPDLKEKCRKMLEVWLENDTRATWKKLCVALQELKLNVLAEQIKNHKQT